MVSFIAALCHKVFSAYLHIYAKFYVWFIANYSCFMLVCHLHSIYGEVHVWFIFISMAELVAVHS
jgi:hypothetical protein